MNRKTQRIIVFLGIVAAFCVVISVLVYRSDVLFEKVLKVERPAIELPTVALPDKKSTRRLVGGPSTYMWTRGRIVIISVTRAPESETQATAAGGPGYVGYEVKFKFTPIELMRPDKIWTQKRINEVLGKEYTLLLANSWYPGPRFLTKYGIMKDATFLCELGLITEGTSTPVVFEFQDIDTKDYFESSIHSEGGTHEA